MIYLFYIDIKIVATFQVEYWSDSNVTLPLFPISIAHLPRMRGFSCVEKQVTNAGCLSVCRDGQFCQKASMPENRYYLIIDTQKSITSQKIEASITKG